MDKHGHIWGAGGSPGQFKFPMGIAFDPAGNAVICDTKNDRVQIMEPGGDILSHFGRTGSAKLDHPRCVFVDSDGRILVGDVTKRVTVFAFC